LGNTSIYLGNTTATIGNLTLTNVIISSGTANITSNITYATANAVVFTNSSSIGTTSAALTFDGSNIVVNSTTPAYFTGTSNLAQISINRSPSTGAIFNASQSAAFINIDGVSGGSSIQFATATANNTQPTEIVRITGTALVGIGTSSPVQKLQVNGAAGNPATSGSTQNGITRLSNTTDNGVLDIGIKSGGTGAWLQSTDGGASGLANQYPLLLNPVGGNLLVGTTDSGSTSGNGFKITSGSGNADAISVVTGASTNAGLTTYQLYSTGASAYRFYVGAGGTIFATSIVITAISDQRLKENVRDIDTGLDAIMALKPRRFDWKEGKGQDKKDVAGFIAQEFEDVFPECVSTSKAGADGIEYKNINHETLIPTLVKAIQELKAEFDAYKATHP
jgi:hypothetical protein